MEWGRRVVAVMALVALTAGCGSRVTQADLERAQGRLSLAAPAASSNANAAAPPSTVPAQGSPAGAAIGDGPGTGSSTGTAPVTPSPDGAAAPPAAGSPSATPAASGRSAARPAAGAASAAAPSAPSPGGPAPAAPPSGATKAPAGEIRLGSVGQASGLIGAAMAPIAEGARVWATDVNARRGIGGRPVRLIQVDDGGNPSRALSIVRRLVEQEHVQAFYSNFMVLTEQAIVPYLEEQQVPAIRGCSCTSAVDPSPMLFPIGPGAPLGEAWAHVLPFLTLTDKRKAPVFYCREAENCTVLAKTMRGFADKAGFTVVHEAQISIAQPDFTGEIIAARNAGADVVVIIADNATAVRAARSAHRQDFHPTGLDPEDHHDDDPPGGPRRRARARHGARLPAAVPHAPRPGDRPHRAPAEDTGPAGEAPKVVGGSAVSLLIARIRPTLITTNQPKNRVAASQN